MLEVLFSDSAAGAMKIAMGRKGVIGGAFGVIVTHDDGTKPTRAEIKKAQREAEERDRQNWESAIPLEGDRKDIFSFPLSLSVGEVDEDGIGPKREQALQSLMGIFPALRDEVVAKTLQTTRESLAALLTRAKNGEPIRIWGSRTPDECCGPCWLLAQLRPLGFQNLNITLVTLPEYEEQPGGATVQYAGWGDVGPHRFGALAACGQALPSSRMRILANCWAELRQENAPLRAVVSGRLLSVPENFYDSFVLRELAALDDEFMEADLVGRVLGKYQLGIGDALIALRIEQFIRDGLLVPLTQPGPEDPLYHRTLRKCRGVKGENC